MSDGIGAVFSGSLFRERNRRKWSQEGLGGKAGLSGQMVPRIELGKSGTTLSTAWRLAGALGVPLGAMLGEAAYVRGESGSKNQGAFNG